MKIFKYHNVKFHNKKCECACKPEKAGYCFFHEKQVAGQDVSGAGGGRRLAGAGVAQGVERTPRHQRQYAFPDRFRPGGGRLSHQVGLPPLRTGARADPARAERRSQFAPAAHGQPDGEEPRRGARRQRRVCRNRTGAAGLSVPQRRLLRREPDRAAVPGAALPVEHCHRHPRDEPPRGRGAGAIPR